MKMKSFNFLFLAICIISGLLFAQSEAQTIRPRLNQGAILEPQGKIINGAGQDPAAFKNYSNVMHENNKPAIFMTYIGLRDVTSEWVGINGSLRFSHSYTLMLK